MKGAPTMNARSDMRAATQDFIVRTAGAIGFDHTAVPKRLLRPSAANSPRYILPSQFVPTYRECMTALYRSSMLSMHTEQASAVPTRDEVELFCSCLIHCEDLREVIVKAIRFARFFNHRGERMSLQTEGGRARFHMETLQKNRSLPALVCDLFGLSFFIKLFSWLIGEPLQASQVELVYRSLIPSDIAEHVAHCPVQFESAGNAFSFDTALLDRPVVRTHRELVQLLRGAPLELIALEAKTDVSSQLERIFRKLLQEGSTLPSLEQVARQVGQTVSTLRRHLAQDDTSYQGIVDKCRMERAVELLQFTAMTVDEIAAHLDYSASSSFSRAFKDWTGCAPSFYRQRLAGQKSAGATANT